MKAHTNYGVSRCFDLTRLGGSGALGYADLNSELIIRAGGQGTEALRQRGQSSGGGGGGGGAGFCKVGMISRAQGWPGGFV